jgi:glycosyltransferase involved in cell wall biosynthesis
MDWTRPSPVAPAAPSPEPEPLVSAIVPYYLSAAYLEEALDSLFGQTHRNIEAIIVNDGSFEEEDGVLLRVAERPGVKVLTQLNAGEAAARNLGIQFADGEYLMMLDADNVLEPEFLERAIDVCRRGTDVAYVSCWLRFIEPDGEPYRLSAGSAHLGNRVMREDVSNWDGDTLALIPHRLFEELGYFHDTEAATNTDWEFYRRLRRTAASGS